MTKEKILQTFEDINLVYNDCTRYDTLKRMLDELQEPCEDCVSKQGVAEILFKYVRPGDDVGKAFVEFLVSQINDLPPVNPQPKTDWIPVSEKPIEKEGRYLTTIINEYDNSLRYMMTCDYISGVWCPDDECASDNVVAWMPLPELYDPQEEGSEE